MNMHKLLKVLGMHKFKVFIEGSYTLNHSAFYTEDFNNYVTYTY